MIIIIIYWVHSIIIIHRVWDLRALHFNDPRGFQIEWHTHNRICVLFCKGHNVQICAAKYPNKRSAVKNKLCRRRFFSRVTRHNLSSVLERTTQQRQQ